MKFSWPLFRKLVIIHFIVNNTIMLLLQPFYQSFHDAEAGIWPQVVHILSQSITWVLYLPLLPLSILDLDFFLIGMDPLLSALLISLLWGFIVHLVLSTVRLAAVRIKRRRAERSDGCPCNATKEGDL